MERASQFGAGPLQLIAMRQRQLPQHGASRRRQPDQHFALVLRTCVPRDGAFVFQPVHQFHGAVMLDEQPRSDLANRRPHVVGKPVYGKQQLMLLGFESVLLGGHFAEMKKFPYLASKFSQIAVLVERKVLSSAHIYIVSRYN